MIYLIHENKEINEINLIYFVKPDFECFYKEIEEKNLPVEIEGKNRKLFYNKTEDKVYAEYEDIPKSKEELLREKLASQDAQLEEIAEALNELILNS